jgi:hypothetical protein
VEDELVAICSARTLQDAHLLCNLLADQGIEATVTNEKLQGGGIDLLGWPTLAGVVVKSKDAVDARRVALDFDRKTGEATMERTLLASREDSDPPWPACPQCGALRSTRCPHCHTAGHEFQPADAGFGDSLGLPAPMGAAPCCGPGGCTAPGAAGASDPSAAPPLVPPGMVICPTCDEPFVPQYAGRCEWCGHEFPDGFEVPQPATGDPTAEEMNWRVAVAALAMVVLAAVVLIYLAYLF